jgi:hypothetical protein
MSNARLVLIAVIGTVSVVGSVARYARSHPARAHVSPSASPELVSEERRMCMTLGACTLGDVSAEELAAAATDCAAAIERRTSGMLDSLAEQGVTRADMASRLAAMNTRCARHSCGDVVECYQHATFMASPFVGDAEN